MALNIRKNAVTERASLLDVPGTQREAKALSRGIGLMDCNVAPPYTAVIPQVVVEVIIVNTKRDLSLLRCHFLISKLGPGVQVKPGEVSAFVSEQPSGTGVIPFRSDRLPRIPLRSKKVQETGI